MINKQRFYPGFHIKHLKFSQFEKRSHDLKEEPDWIRFLKSEGRPEAIGMKMILEREQTD